jgi:hypothetical protein
LSKKTYPFTPNYPSINQNPTNSDPKQNIRIQKNVHFSNFAHEKTCRFNCPPATDHRPLTTIP